MGLFANAESRRCHSKVTKTVRISDEFRHSLQPHRNLVPCSGSSASRQRGIAHRDRVYGSLARRATEAWPSSR
jgi:hypothetical protein